MIQLPEINYSKAVNFIVNSIQNEMNRNGHSKAVLGLSGGIDSAFVATLASLALGKENVTGSSRCSY